MEPVAKRHAAEAKDLTLEFPLSSIRSKKIHLLQKVLEITNKHSGS